MSTTTKKTATISTTQKKAPRNLRIGLCGASGRVGQEIFNELVPGNAEVEIAVSRRKPIGAFKNWFEDFQSVKGARSCEVWLDFSSPELLISLLEVAVATKKPVVSGTTGMTDEQMRQIHKAAKQIPILWSSNMSLGVAVLKKSIETFRNLRGFDFAIDEIHHKFKKDAPSGTALQLKQHLELAVDATVNQVNSLRGGGVVGDHRVWALGPDEVLVFEHQALHRRIFAQGALYAAHRIVSFAPGFYSMEEVLL